MSTIKPPEPHPLLTYGGGNIFLKVQDLLCTLMLTPDEAVTLGLRLMEGGLYLKQVAKEQDNGTNAP